jgi:hypothetical protein
MSRLPTLLLLSLTTTLLACAVDEGPDDQTCQGDKCDDLIGRDLEVIGKANPIRVQGLGAYSVTPEISVAGESIDVLTEDLRFNLADLVGAKYLKIRVDSGEDRETRYGFRIEYHAPGDKEGFWTPISAVNGDDAWNWNYAMLEDLSVLSDDGPTFALDGKASRYKDAFGGVWDPSEELKEFKGLGAFAKDMEFRILVLPQWNFWDWDPDGYDTVVTFEECAVLCDE